MFLTQEVNLGFTFCSTENKSFLGYSVRPISRLSTEETKPKKKKAKNKMALVKTEKNKQKLNLNLNQQ